MPDLPISGLTADTAPTGDDLVILVNDPGGTPGSRKATLTNLFASTPFGDGVFAYVDTDTTLAADDDAVIPSQHAVKTYADDLVTDAIFVTDNTVAPAGNYWDFVDNDTALAADSATKLPTQHAVKAYVDANAGGGDVNTSDTDVTGWGFVLDEDTMASDSATKLPTQQSVKAYVDGLSTLTTSNTVKVPISTVGGVTTLDVDGLLSTTDADFSDAAFSIYNASDNTKIATFDTSALTTGTTYVFAFPAPADSTPILVTTDATQTMTAKTLYQPVVWAPVVGGSSMQVSAFAVAQPLNTAGHGIEIYPSAGTGQHIAFAHCGGSVDIPTQTSASAVIARITARGYTSSSAYSTGAPLRIDGVATEAPTTGVRGSHWEFYTTPTGGTTVTHAMKISADTVPQTIHRGPIVYNAGSSMASARTALAFDQATEGGFAVNPATTLTYASPTSVDTTKGPLFKVTTVNATGSVTFNATTGGVDGQVMIIRITNDATSGKTITFGTNFKSQATLVGTISKVCQIWFVSDGTNWYEVGRSGAAGGTTGM